jgi:hypothetical protein
MTSVITLCLPSSPKDPKNLISQNPVTLTPLEANNLHCRYAISLNCWLSILVGLADICHPIMLLEKVGNEGSNWGRVDLHTVSPTDMALLARPLSRPKTSTLPPALTAEASFPAHQNLFLSHIHPTKGCSTTTLLTQFERLFNGSVTPDTSHAKGPSAWLGDSRLA